MRMFTLCASLGLACLSTAQDPTDQGNPDTAVPSTQQAYEQFLRSAGGHWVAQWNRATKTPSAIYGTGLPLAGFENTLAGARRHANQALHDHRTLLGLGTSEFREIIGSRMGRSWSFTYDQYFRGLPVVGGRADVRINMNGTIAMLGSTAWPIPADFDVAPRIDAEVATAIAWRALEQSPNGRKQPGATRAPQLVVWGDVDADASAPFFLAWEVPISNVDADGIGPIGRQYVDAQTGAALHFANDKHECGFANCMNAHHGTARTDAVGPAPAGMPFVPTTVTVMAWTRNGISATSPLQNIPLEGLVVNVPGVGSRTTDSNGQFSIDIAAPVTISVTQLDGIHCAPVADSSGNTPNASVTVQPGVAATLQLLTSGATQEQATHPSMIYWTRSVNEFCRAIIGNTSQLATASNIAPTVNIGSTCNAFYTGNTINFYAQGGSCNNTGFSTVIAHEWGHGLDDRYGGISNASNDGLSEGWGDICGMYLVDNPIVGQGFNVSGSGIRTGLNNTMFGTQTQVHAAGQVWMGFAWRLRENLRTALGTTQALAISNDIVIGSIVADATNQTDAVREVFLADDDDGNLLNGTPHYAQLSAAAITKGIPYPEIQVGTLTHAPLANTTVQLTPRRVLATASPIGGTFTQVRLHFNAGSVVVRPMVPTGAPNQYQALLPGLLSGSGLTYHIEAVHSTNVVLRLPASGEFSYSVGNDVTFFSEGFETGAPGWTSAQVATQNDWQIGDPAGRTGTSQGVAWADPQTAAVGTNCAGNDLGNTIGGQTWNGAYAANVSNWFRSPVIDCTGRSGVRLRFKRWLSVENSVFDFARIRVNGTEVWVNPSASNLVDTSWQQVDLAIPAANNNPSVQIEWSLESDAGLQLGGWNIDDVELVAAGAAQPLDAQLRLLPEQAQQGAPLTLNVLTQGGPKLFALLIGDTAGPTTIPGVPTIAVGGNLLTFSAVTNGAGIFGASFGAPPVAAATGLLWYSQVLTFDASNTTIVASNQFVNLFVQ